MRILISNTVISLPKKYKGVVQDPTIIIGEKGLMFSGCVFENITIRIQDGGWLKDCFVNCVFNDCSVEAYRNTIDVGGNILYGTTRKVGR